METGEEIASGFVVTSGDAAALFESCEQTLDVIAFAVQLSVVGALDFAVPLGRNDRLTTLSVDRLKHHVAIVALVGDDVFAASPSSNGVA